jgi:hypothetical protein
MDSTGKFISYVLFIDYRISKGEILAINSVPVIGPAKPGAFDEHGIFPFSPVVVGKDVWAYTCGWSRRVSVSVETGIGLAISTDNGATFQRMGDGPIMGPSLSEPFLVGDPFVAQFGNQFHMWYIYGTKWIVPLDSTTPERVYKIGHAVSIDGISFTREGRPIIPDILGDTECQALPTVIFHDGLYHMVFCYRHVTGFRSDSGRAYRLGYAWSSDLIHWTRNDDRLGLQAGLPGEWDGDMMCYPHLFQYEGKVYLLYNGNQFGRFGFGMATLDE